MQRDIDEGGQARMGVWIALSTFQCGYMYLDGKVTYYAVEAL